VFRFTAAYTAAACTAVLIVFSSLAVPQETRAQPLRQRLQRAREDANNSREPAGAARESAGNPRGSAANARLTAQSVPVSESVARWVNHLGRLQPKDADGYAELHLQYFAQGISGAEYWCGQLARFEGADRPQNVLQMVEQLLAAKAGVDRQLETAFAERTGFAALAHERRQTAISNYLWATSSWIDLSGRLRYTLFDALNVAADTLAGRPNDYNRLLDLLVQYKSGIGAVAVAPGLFDPAPGDVGAVAVSLPAKLTTLRLIAESGNYELVPDVARLIKQPRIPPQLVLAAAHAIDRLGIPQNERPGQDPTLPKPSITAGELASILEKLEVRSLTADERRTRDELLARATAQAESGLAADKYRLGSFDIEPGDWLLMRNPSPYNLFTELSPGLFTHVGVAAIETGTDGVRRMVIIDIPETGPEMPATNADAFVQRTRHFVFMRHPDAAAAARMADAAAATIGNVTEFDLNFRTDRVLALKGQPLAGKKVHTYCAGFLYLCALQTDRPREEFFPLEEGPAEGYTAQNLAKFGFTFGEGFISPTGAFFSPTLQLIGRREPMYDPRREIEEAVFDHFAQSLMAREVTPAPDAFQRLRLKVAEAAKQNPLLAKAVANTVGVAEDMDLVAAAKAKALVETLDEIAYAASGEFLAARDAIMAGAPYTAARPSPPKSAADQARTRELRARHRALVDRWESNQLTPRALRIELVQYYVAEGKKKLEERFFASGGD
jgi:hypothetical protein